MDKAKSSFNTEKGVLKILRWGEGWNFVCVLVYLLFPKSLFAIVDLFAVRYLWVVCNEDKWCVVTHRAVDILRRLACILGFFTLARIACLLQLWVKTSKLDYSIWATPK